LEANEPLICHAASVEARKASWKRARKAAPPTVLPENHLLAKMFSPKKPQINLLKGKGTSPGQVTAPACVLRGPDDFGQMRPGDVLVAVATTPAWTPLFAMASAVVTDIGGARVRHPGGNGYRRGHPSHSHRTDDHGRWGRGVGLDRGFESLRREL